MHDDIQIKSRKDSFIDFIFVRPAPEIFMDIPYCYLFVLYPLIYTTIGHQRRKTKKIIDQFLASRL